jgi:predicted GIY-YIG superfamily endonuclease
MDARFRERVDSLEPQFQRLVAMTPVKYGSLPRQLPSRGVYLFSDGQSHLYVGRTNGLRQRLQNHCRPSGSHFTATFAFRMARQDTGHVKATYNKAGSREALIRDPEFARAFEAAKRRVAAFDIRYVEEADPTRQVLLEIYSATVLGTPYNDFENH